MDVANARIYTRLCGTLRNVPYSTEITPTLIACYKAATGGMGLKIVAEDGKIHVSITFITLSNYA